MFVMEVDFFKICMYEFMKYVISYVDMNFLRNYMMWKDNSMFLPSGPN